MVLKSAHLDHSLAQIASSVLLPGVASPKQAVRDGAGPGCPSEHPWEVAGRGPASPGQKHLQTELIIWLTVTFQCPAVTSGTL